MTQFLMMACVATEVLGPRRESGETVVRGAMEQVGWVLWGWERGDAEVEREARWREVCRRREGVSMRRIRGVEVGWR